MTDLSIRDDPRHAGRAADIVHSSACVTNEGSVEWPLQSFRAFQRIG